MKMTKLTNKGAQTEIVQHASHLPSTGDSTLAGGDPLVRRMGWYGKKDPPPGTPAGDMLAAKKDMEKFF